MTDDTGALDRAERLRRLQARQAPRGSTGDTAGARRAPARRRHPAAATRWLLAGLSSGSFFTIAGAIAVANHYDAGTPASVVDSTGATATATGATPRTATSPTTTSHTTTRAS
jgi:hypothetical protein